MKSKNDLKILLMQVRRDDETIQEELDEFVRYSGLSAEQFTQWNLFEKTNFDHSVLDGFDALFIGGSSDATVLDPEGYPFLDDLFKLLQYALEHNFPVLASCYGFEAAVAGLGGTIIEDEEYMEAGIFDLSLTPDGHRDRLFHDIPTPFAAVSGHKERAQTLPLGAINLVYSPMCPYHAFTFPGKPFYGFQFHPEIDRDDLVARLIRYGDRYVKDKDVFDKLISEAKAASDTPHSNSLVEQFVNRIILGGD